MDIISMRIPELPIPAINCVLTFRPYLHYIEEQIANTKSAVYRQFLESIAVLIKNSPELLVPITDMSVLDKHKELIELIKITHLSQVKSDGMLYTLGVPSGQPPIISYFGYSDEFAEFYKEKGRSLKLYSTTVGEEFRRNTYREILQKAYRIHVPEPVQEPMLQLVYEGRNAKQYYKVIRRHQFAEVTVDGKMPEVRQEWLDYASGTIARHEELQEPLPFEKFIIEGFFIFSMLSDTDEVALAELNGIVSQIHAGSNDVNTIDKIKQATLSLLGSDNIEVGFLPFMKVNDKYVYHDFFTNISIVFGKLREHFSPAELNDIFNTAVSQAADCDDILASVDSNLFNNAEGCVAEDHIQRVLKSDGLKDLKFIPVRHNDTLLGFIELGSKDENEINVEMLRKLDAAIPVYRDYFMHKTTAFHEYMEAFIRQRYTAVQESVAWKFNEEVWNALKKSDGKQFVSTPPVKFEDLYPFYGAVDFRNSTQKQIEAIHSDYKAQLHHLEIMLQKDDVLKEDKQVKDFLAQIRYWRYRLCNNIDIEEEVDLRTFLETESVSFINLMAEQGKLDAWMASVYSSSVLNKNGDFHLYHNMYEASLQKLNMLLKEQLFNTENELQERVPHYFEKFQTDGIEYSLYAGKGINPSKPFPADGVDAIIKWQMDTMLKLALAAHKFKHKLDVQLETTQLILVHENKVDISYRIDERHFDVEGSYSIRYEVLKKRIDKVRLFNSTERLTQPGTIAIVYAHKNSITTYLDKINEMMQAGSLHPGIEYLDLEQLQGIGKLKAIRVKINTGDEPALKLRTGDTVTLKD